MACGLDKTHQAASQRANGISATSDSLSAILTGLSNSLAITNHVTTTTDAGKFAGRHEASDLLLDKARWPGHEVSAATSAGDNQSDGAIPSARHNHSNPPVRYHAATCQKHNTAH
jgi:hypothetical protein